MTRSPEPAVGQVWEDGYGGSYAGRRVRIVRRLDVRDCPSDAMDWRCTVIAYPAHPKKVGATTFLSGKTLRTKWLHIPDGDDAEERPR